MNCMKTHRNGRAMTYYKGKIFSLAEENATIKGRHVRVAVIRENDAVVVLPLLGKGTLVLEEQYRPVVRKRIYELPAGHIEKGETPEHAGRRELKEELGYRIASMKFMFKAYPQPGTVTSMHYFYYAKCSKSGKPAPEENEDIIAKRVTLGKALEMIKANKIIDTKSIAAILYYVNFAKQK